MGNATQILAAKPRAVNITRAALILLSAKEALHTLCSSRHRMTSNILDLRPEKGHHETLSSDRTFIKKLWRNALKEVQMPCTSL